MSGVEAIASLLTLAEACRGSCQVIRNTANASGQARKQSKALCSRSRLIKNLAHDIEKHGTSAMTKKASKSVKKAIQLLDEFNQKTKYLSRGYRTCGINIGCLEAIKRFVRATLHRLRWGFRLSSTTRYDLGMQRIESEISIQHQRSVL